MAMDPAERAAYRRLTLWAGIVVLAGLMLFGLPLYVMWVLRLAGTCTP